MIHSTELFPIIARRNVHLAFVESYSSMVRRSQFAVVTAMGLLLIIVGQVTVAGLHFS